jgi:hypothetical protein
VFVVEVVGNKEDAAEELDTHAHTHGPPYLALSLPLSFEHTRTRKMDGK